MKDMIIAVMKQYFKQLPYQPEKGISPQRDVILSQLSYEAIQVGSSSICGFYPRVKGMNQRIRIYEFVHSQGYSTKSIN